MTRKITNTLINTLAVTALLATANFGFINQANAQETQQAQQESTREQIENTIQPHGNCYLVPGWGWICI